MNLGPKMDAFKTFHAYQQYCQQVMQEKLIPRFPKEDPRRILELNTPFDWQPEKPTKTGIMMIHGMYGSSFSMRDLAKRFVQNGLHARSLLLPGHCADPADLCKVDLADYQHTVKSQIELFQHESGIDNLYLLGFSFGGLLSLDYTNHYLKLNADTDLNSSSIPKVNIAGLILLSPALGLQSPLASLLPLADCIKPLKWYCKRKETDFTRYQSCAVHAAQQVNQLIKDQADFATMTLPKILVSTSMDDEVVCPHATIDFFNAINPPEKYMILYGNEEAFEQENIIFRNSHFPEDKILNASHINLIFSPENSHYGRNGTAPNLLYKLPPSKNKEAAYGAVTKKNLKSYNIYRASYNPEFDYFADQLTGFITSPELKLTPLRASLD